MAKKEFSSFQTFLTLFLVCLFSAGILSAVYILTKEPIREAKEQEKQDALKVVLPPETEDIEMVTVQKEQEEYNVYIAKDSGGNVTGYALETMTSQGYGGNIRFLLGLDENGKIYNYYITQHSETPGLGDNLRSDSFKSQFKGRDLENFTFKVEKDGGDVQAITAATISSRAACDALKKGLERFEDFSRGE